MLPLASKTAVKQLKCTKRKDKGTTAILGKTLEALKKEKITLLKSNDQREPILQKSLGGVSIFLFVNQFVTTNSLIEKY